MSVVVPQSQRPVFHLSTFSRLAFIVLRGLGEDISSTGGTSQAVPSVVDAIRATSLPLELVHLPSGHGVRVPLWAWGRAGLDTLYSEAGSMHPGSC